MPGLPTSSTLFKRKGPAGDDHVIPESIEGKTASAPVRKSRSGDHGPNRLDGRSKSGATPDPLTVPELAFR
jgi:hypothetical protein